MINENNSLVDFACRIENGVSILIALRADLLLNGATDIKSEFANLNTDLDQVMHKYDIDIHGKKPQKDWREEAPNELISHLIANFHESHRNQLPEIIKLASKVEAVHSEHKECPHGLAAQLEKMLLELESHMNKEEMILFPMIAQGLKNMAGGPIFVMQQEHISHIEEIERLTDLTNNFIPPSDACNSWRLLYQFVNDFILALCEHIHLENNILFAD